MGYAGNSQTFRIQLSEERKIDIARDLKFVEGLREQVPMGDDATSCLDETSDLIDIVSDMRAEEGDEEVEHGENEGESSTAAQGDPNQSHVLQSGKIYQNNYTKEFMEMTYNAKILVETAVSTRCR